MGAKVMAQDLARYPEAIDAFSHSIALKPGDADALNGNRPLGGVVIFSIGLGNVDDVLLKRIANDPSLTPNPPRPCSAELGPRARA